MNDITEHTKHALQDLLTRAYDAEQGFEHAAEAVKHDGLASLFREYSAQRRDFGGEIKTLQRSLGAEPDKGPSVLGKLHQWWIDLRGKLSDGREHEILDECLRGEETTMDDYREYIRDTDITPGAHELMTSQLEQIEMIYHRLQKLELAAESMDS